MNTARQVRFGTFEVEVQTGELRRSGVRIRLQEQPFKVLLMLLERPGELIAREELKQRLWTDSEFGDFDQGINVAIKKIRTALGDSSENPRFVETLSRRGYRFIAPVTTDAVTPEAEEVALTEKAVGPATAADKSRRWIWVAVAMAALITVIAVMPFLRQPREHSLGIVGAGNFRLAPLTSSMGWEMEPQFSPDGKEIAFVWSPENNEPPDIYVKVLGSGNPVRLLPRQENVAHFIPSWSPDGKFIACYRMKKPDTKPDDPANAMRVRPEAGIYQVPIVGGEEKKLFNTDFVTDLRWSPDGAWFLIAQRTVENGPMALFRYSLDGSERKQLSFPPPNYSGDTIPTFSPDGKWIAFSRNLSSGGSDIFLMPASGGEPKRLTFDAQHLRGISFTADGRELIFSSAREGGARRAIWRIPVDGGKPVRLPFGGADNADYPVVALSGDHLAYLQDVESTKIYAYDLPAPGEKVNPGDKPTPGRVAIGSRQLQVGPQFSPDGKRVAFASSRTGSWEIWVSGPDGANPVQLTTFGDRQTGSPRWSADGKQIVFDARPEKRSDIFVIDSEGGRPRRLTNGPKDNVVPSFSHDGRWVYYSSNANGGWDLWKMAADGSGSPVQVTHNGGFSATESPDRQTLYYAKWDKPGIFSMPVGGGEETLVIPELIAHAWGCWGTTSAGIYLLRPIQNPETKKYIPSVAFYNFADKTLKDLRAIDNPPNPGPALGVSPDGKLLLVAQPDEEGSDIMIVDNFR